MYLTETQVSNLNKLRVYFSHRTEAPRQIVRLGPHYPQGTSQMWLLWLLVPVKWPEHLHASYPCPNSKKGVELSKNVHTRLVYSLLIRKTITFHRHPTSRLLYLIVQNVITWLLLAAKESEMWNFLNWAHHHLEQNWVLSVRRE